MKVEKMKTETYKITGAKALDPVTVYVTNYEVGQGKMVMECFGRSWSVYWGGMGNRNLQSFVLTCNNDYIANKMVENCTQTDFDEVNKIARQKGYSDICVQSDTEIAMMQERMSECFGDDWYMDLPQCSTSEYSYICRILDAVKAAFQQEIKGDAR